MSLVSGNRARNRELRVIEKVEELRPELDRLFLADSRHLGKGEIEIGLARSTNDSNAGVAEVRSIADRRRSTKRGCIKEARRIRIARSSKTILHAPLGFGLIGSTGR